jgi:hypothetical protein
MLYLVTVNISSTRNSKQYENPRSLGMSTSYHGNYSYMAKISRSITTEDSNCAPKSIKISRFGTCQVLAPSRAYIPLIMIGHTICKVSSSSRIAPLDIRAHLVHFKGDFGFFDIVIATKCWILGLSATISDHCRLMIVIPNILSARN